MTSLRFGRKLLGLGLAVAVLSGMRGDCDTLTATCHFVRRFTSWIGSHAQAFIPR